MRKLGEYLEYGFRTATQNTTHSARAEFFFTLYRATLRSPLGGHVFRGPPEGGRGCRAGRRESKKESDMERNRENERKRKVKKKEGDPGFLSGAAVSRLLFLFFGIRLASPELRPTENRNLLAVNLSILGVRSRRDHMRKNVQNGKPLL